MPVTRNNHSVPEAYLRGWSSDGTHVLARRLLVPVSTYPEWERRRVGSLTAYQHLYTVVSQGQESDDLEQWLNNEFESPAALVLARVRENARLTADDFRKLAYYVASQDVRTPASFLEQKQRWERDLEGQMAEIMEEAKTELAEAARSGVPLTPRAPVEGARPPFRVKLDRDAPGGPVIKAEIAVGRELWHFQIRHVLSGVARVLALHKWHIVRPYPGYTWFTTDHPVLRLNFNNPTEYDFGGGWGKKGSEMLMPLSPQHMLYTQIGYSHSGLTQFSKEQTELLQKLLAERAFRWIIAHDSQAAPRVTRPRRVDKEAFREEEKAWNQWHATQSAAEAGEQPAA